MLLGSRAYHLEYGGAPVMFLACVSIGIRWATWAGSVG